MIALSEHVAVTTVILMLVAALVIGWGGGYWYEHHQTKREQRNKQLDDNVAARYRGHEYDELIVEEVEYDIPAGTYGDPLRRLRGVMKKPHNWRDDEPPLVIDDLQNGTISDAAKQQISDWYWQRDV